MLERLRHVIDEYETLEHQLSDPDVLADPDQLRRLSKRYNDLGPVVEAYRRHATRVADGEAAREMLDGATGDERAMLADEVESAARDAEAIEAELRELMIPRDPHDGRAVIIEVRGAEGGEEANLFARDLYEMYLAFAARHGWKTTTLSSSPSEMGGVNDVTFEVRGATAWRNLKYEGGPHRVQRVPATESQGRIHTSAATVAVFPQAEPEDDIAINPEEIRIDIYRASGAGGQHVNTTDSAVRITHLPTGIVVQSQDERSQHKNKARALKVLQARILDAKRREQEERMGSERRNLIGSGDRSQRVRTYNFPQNRITDHRINLTLYSLDKMMEGAIDELVEGLQAQDTEMRLTAELDLHQPS